MNRREPVAPGHNRKSLQQLIDYVDARCQERCQQVLDEAREEAARIRREARDRAARLLHEARVHERRTAERQLAAERARQRSRLRERLLEDRRAAAEQALPMLVNALDRLWKSTPEARAAWLERALTDARRTLLNSQWTVHAPADWEENEARDVAERFSKAGTDDDELGTSGISIRFEVGSDAGQDPNRGEGRDRVHAGFRISAGRVVIDATPAGLVAREAYMAGLLLARLPEEAPEIDE